MDVTCQCDLVLYNVDRDDAVLKFGLVWTGLYKWKFLSGAKCLCTTLPEELVIFIMMMDICAQNIHYHP